jgi:hypothetical protein
MESHIAIRNGNGIHNLAHSTRSRLHPEGYRVAAINTDKILIKLFDVTIDCC